MPMMKDLTTIKAPKCFNTVSGRCAVSSGIESIDESLKLLILTAKGELLGDPNYGTNIFEYLYEPNDLMLQSLVQDDLINAISIYEPRVEMLADDISVTTNRDSVTIILRYTVVSTGLPEEFQLSMLRGNYNGEQ